MGRFSRSGRWGSFWFTLALGLGLTAVSSTPARSQNFGGFGGGNAGFGGNQFGGGNGGFGGGGFGGFGGGGMSPMGGGLQGGFGGGGVGMNGFGNSQRLTTTPQVGMAQVGNLIMNYTGRRDTWQRGSLNNGTGAAGVGAGIGGFAPNGGFRSVPPSRARINRARSLRK